MSAEHHYAHTLPGRPPSHWEPLREHLDLVARLAAEFSSKWDAADWGRLAGLWHDLGKYSDAFQSYLFRESGFDLHRAQVSGRVDHSTAGAQHAMRTLRDGGRILAYCIAGHHAGLADADDDDGLSGLNDRLKKKIPSIEAAPPDLLAAVQLPDPKLSLDPRDSRRCAFQVALFARMLFSCLVDADFLATEGFMSRERAQVRQAPKAVLPALLAALDDAVSAKVDASERNEVFHCRQEVLSACRRAADEPPGLFSLTVPTGGGKTLASLAFALAHAVEHGFERVIYAIPFTSIIEQTADVFRSVFQNATELAVIEHHSNLDPDDPERESQHTRLAAENWDAPIVVTTNVQFFESLFAARTSRCRKLHRIAKSVVILDEAQSLPVDLLEPCLSVLRELAADYHCSIVLCTATQPAIHRREAFPIGLENVREIMPDPTGLYARMRRTKVERMGRIDNAKLVEQLRRHGQFLCIVNTRKHAATLYQMLAADSSDVDHAFHLSTLMSGRHRASVLQEIRDRLKTGRPCQVVSTQLIEAGVDVDFPVVFRSLSGIDSVAQAAGRCNREGKAPIATVFLFEPAEAPLKGYLRTTAESAAELLSEFEDLLSLEAVNRYFQLHYWRYKSRWDQKQIMENFKSAAKQVFQFRTAAAAFQFIEDNSRPIFVGWDEAGKRLVEELKLSSQPDRR